MDTFFPPSPPHSGYESPAAAEAASLAESTAVAPAEFLTHCEKTHYQETGRYDETLKFARKFQKASPYVRVLTLGRTGQGRDLMLLVVSKDQAFTPQAAVETGKPILLIQNGIHPGEISGKEASHMLLRDILITKRYAGWLDHLILLVIPVFNVDGHERVSLYNRINQNGPREMGFRANGQRFNLNRDYIKADTPEMRAWLKMWTAWLPDFFMDNHVTDGLDHQYDVTISMSTEQEVWPTVGKWTRDKFLPAVMGAMEQDGHIIGPYYEPRNLLDLADGIEGGPTQPRYSNGYTVIHNRPGLLVETHSLKSHRTQTWAHYDLMRHTFDLIAQTPKVLKKAVRDADEAIARLGTKYHPKNKLFINGTVSPEGEPITLKGVAYHQAESDISSATYIVFGTEPVDIPTTFYNKITTTAAPTVPLGYIVPVQWTSVIDLLKLHGVKTEVLPKEVSGEFETYRFFDVKWAERPFEGRHRVEFTSALTREQMTLPAGSVYVPMNQRAGRVALNLLEPDAADSAVRWGFFDTIFEQKETYSEYVMEQIALEMLEQSPELREEFEERLEADEEFAQSPQARLDFFYHRSGYAEPDKDLYPVVRITKELSIS